LSGADVGGFAWRFKLLSNSEGMKLFIRLINGVASKNRA